MDHEQAITTQAAERYTLNELPPEEREAFEEHYFSCEECADAVRTCTLFAVNTKALAKEEANRPSNAGQVVAMAPRPARRVWPEWIAAVAAVLLLGVVGFQNLVTIPQLARRASSPIPLESVLLRPLTRGTTPVVHTQGHPLVLDLELDGSNPASYEVTVRGGSGAAFAPFMAPPSKDGILHIEWPAGTNPGDYEILVRDPSRNSTQAFSMHVER
jgi:hypothetical protein